MSHLNSTQRKFLERLKFLQDEVADCALIWEDCPLLVRQLGEMEVFVDRLASTIGEMQNTLGSD